MKWIIVLTLSGLMVGCASTDNQGYRHIRGSNRNDDSNSLEAIRNNVVLLSVIPDALDIQYSILGSEVGFLPGSDRLAQSIGPTSYMHPNIYDTAHKLDVRTEPVAGMIALGKVDTAALKSSIAVQYQQCVGQFLRSNQISTVHVTFTKHTYVANPNAWEYMNIASYCKNRSDSHSWVATEIFSGMVDAQIHLTADNKVPSACISPSASIITPAGDHMLQFSTSGWNLVQATSLSSVCEMYQTMCKDLSVSDSDKKLWNCSSDRPQRNKGGNNRHRGNGGAWGSSSGGNFPGSGSF